MLLLQKWVREIYVYVTDQSMICVYWALYLSIQERFNSLFQCWRHPEPKTPLLFTSYKLFCKMIRLVLRKHFYLFLLLLCWNKFPQSHRREAVMVRRQSSTWYGLWRKAVRFPLQVALCFFRRPRAAFLNTLVADRPQEGEWGI